MGLEINHPNEEDTVATHVATERLCLTEPDENGEQHLVPEDSLEARWLFCVPGQEIPFAEAEKYGLVKAEKVDAVEPPKLSKKQLVARAKELGIEGAGKGSLKSVDALADAVAATEAELRAADEPGSDAA